MKEVGITVRIPESYYNALKCEAELREKTVEEVVERILEPQMVRMSEIKNLVELESGKKVEEIKEDKKEEDIKSELYGIAKSIKIWEIQGKTVEEVQERNKHLKMTSVKVYLSQLKNSGLLETRGDLYYLTPEGVKVAYSVLVS